MHQTQLTQLLLLVAPFLQQNQISLFANLNRKLHAFLFSPKGYSLLLRKLKPKKTRVKTRPQLILLHQQLVDQEFMADDATEQVLALSEKLMVERSILLGKKINGCLDKMQQDKTNISSCKQIHEKLKIKTVSLNNRAAYMQLKNHWLTNQIITNSTAFSLSQQQLASTRMSQTLRLQDLLRLRSDLMARIGQLQEQRSCYKEQQEKAKSLISRLTKAMRWV